MAVFAAMAAKGIPSPDSKEDKKKDASIADMMSKSDQLKKERLKAAQEERRLQQAQEEERQRQAAAAKKKELMEAESSKMRQRMEAEAKRKREEEEAEQQRKEDEERQPRKTEEDGVTAKQDQETAEKSQRSQSRRARGEAASAPTSPKSDKDSKSAKSLSPARADDSKKADSARDQSRKGDAAKADDRGAQSATREKGKLERQESKDRGKTPSKSSRKKSPGQGDESGQQNTRDALEERSTEKEPLRAESPKQATLSDILSGSSKEPGQSGAASLDKQPRTDLPSKLTYAFVEPLLYRDDVKLPSGKDEEPRKGPKDKKVEGQQTEQKKQSKKDILADVKEILKGGASPHEWDGPETPIRMAVIGRSPQLVELLIRAAANPDEADQKGVSLLHFAAFDNQPEICKALLERGANVNIRDKHGQTPMFFAHNTQVCRELTSGKADLTVKNRRGQTCLHLAGRAGASDILLYFVSKVSQSLLDHHDDHGATALYYARVSGVKNSTIRQIRSTAVCTHVPAPICATSHDIHSDQGRGVAQEGEAEATLRKPDWGDEDGPQELTERQKQRLEALMKSQGADNICAFGRMDPCAYQAELARRQKEYRNFIRSIDVDAVLLRIATWLIERRIRFRDWFVQFDSKQNGELTRKDLQASLREIDVKITPEEFHALEWSFDPSGKQEVYLLDLDENMRRVVKKNYLMTARDNSVKRLRESYLPPGGVPSGLVDREDEEISGYDTEEEVEDATTTELSIDVKCEAPPTPKITGPKAVAAARAKFAARSRGWVKKRERSCPPSPIKARLQDFEEIPKPSSPVKSNRDRAAEEEKQRAKVWRQKKVAEQRAQMLDLRKATDWDGGVGSVPMSPTASRAMSSTTSSPGAFSLAQPRTGTWAEAKTIPVQMTKDHTPGQDEMDATLLTASATIREMFRHSIADDVELIKQSQRELAKKTKAIQERKAKEEAHRLAEQNEQDRHHARTKAEQRWEDVEQARKEKRREKSRREVEAANHIQRMWRGRKERQKFHILRNIRQIQNKAATQIQKRARGIAGRKRFAKIKKQKRRAATNIQSAFRGHKGRQKVALLRLQRDDRARKATKIQALFRGRLARKQVETAKQKVETAKQSQIVKDYIKALVDNYVEEIMYWSEDGMSKEEAEEAAAEAWKKIGEYLGGNFQEEDDEAAKAKRLAERERRLLAEVAAEREQDYDETLHRFSLQLLDGIEPEEEIETF